ncbi:GTPase IMAP family member 7-like [Chanos chanos]|uniref:GTPase IMAP family member 7-like n=1 Tax=Chanos chanos TaxID=29144 RepID=A0A6J2VT41_CHACN|nr:GTPase IMAP family member 7-like [Chanos chanos]
MNFTTGTEEKGLRLVLLGKTGDGRSGAGNTILNDKVFPTKSSPNSVTQQCTSKSGTIHERPVKVIDTPGFFDTDGKDDELRYELVKCITECAPGVHAFLIVLKVGRYTEQEKEVVKKITETFGEDALRYSVVLFTHGDQLSDGQTIEDFVKETKALQELVDKCGGRCHVVDNKHWNQQKDEYRNNSVQTKKLLDTIEKMLRENGGNYYTNALLQKIEEDIQAEEKRTREHETGNKSDKEIREMAQKNVFKKFLTRFAGMATGALLGAFLGVGVLVGAAVYCIKGVLDGIKLGTLTEAGAGAGAAARIRFKTLVLAYQATTGSAPSYLQSLITPYSPARSLWSTSSGQLVVPSLREPGSRSSRARFLSAIVPRSWNDLPHSVRTTEYLAIFRRELKTHLFRTHLSPTA